MDSIFTVEAVRKTVKHSGAARCTFSNETKESTIFADYDNAKAFALDIFEDAKRLHRDTYTKTTDAKGRRVLTYENTDIWVYRSKLNTLSGMYLFAEMLGHLDSSDAMTAPRLVLSNIK